MLVVSILRGPNGRWFATSNHMDGEVTSATTSCSALSAVLWEEDNMECATIRIMPWSLREAAEDLMPPDHIENIYKAIERNKKWHRHR